MHVIVATSASILVILNLMHVTFRRNRKKETKQPKRWSLSSGGYSVDWTCSIIPTTSCYCRHFDGLISEANLIKTPPLFLSSSSWSQRNRSRTTGKCGYGADQCSTVRATVTVCANWRLLKGSTTPRLVILPHAVHVMAPAYASLLLSRPSCHIVVVICVLCTLFLVYDGWVFALNVALISVCPFTAIGFAMGLLCLNKSFHNRPNSPFHSWRWVSTCIIWHRRTPRRPLLYHDGNTKYSHSTIGCFIIIRYNSRRL